MSYGAGGLSLANAQNNIYGHLASMELPFVLKWKMGAEIDLANSYSLSQIVLGKLNKMCWKGLN